MAKRIQFAAYGGPEVLEYRDYQPPSRAPGKSACAIAPLA